MIGRRVRVTACGVVTGELDGGALSILLDGAGGVPTFFLAGERAAASVVLLDEEAELLALLAEARRTFPTEEASALLERLKAALRG